jgi:hypothetical protein
MSATEHMQPMSAQFLTPSVYLSAELDQPPHVDLQLKLIVNPETAQLCSARPYNLDQLVIDCAKADLGSLPVLSLDIIYSQAEREQ